MKNYINKIGVEIEGGWEDKPDELKCDVSVNNELADYTGEVVSYPMTIDEVKDWILNNYPDATDDSCGLHVHLSFIDNVYYQLLMSRHFYTFYIKKMYLFKNKIGNAYLEDRLNGYNTYCKDEYNPDEQAAATNKECIRYALINYCYNQHGTIEFRALPAFDNPRDAVRAVLYTIKIVNYYLDNAIKRRNKPKKIKISLKTRIKGKEEKQCAL